MSETFLSRWSRRKRAASIESPVPGEQRTADEARSIPPSASEASGGEGGERSEPVGGEHSRSELTQAPPTPDPSPPRAPRAGGGEPHGPAPQEAAFDPTSLPPVESIGAGTDVSAFLRPGVPADLAQAALRRAWVADPAIRHFVGLAENAWDFNAPGGVPGFGPLRAIDDVQRLAAQVANLLPPNDAEAAGSGKNEVAETPQAAVAPAPVPNEAEAEVRADACAPQQDPPTERADLTQRPRHGGALAE